MPGNRYNLILAQKKQDAYGYFFGHALWHAESQVPNQGSNPHTLQGNCGVSTTGSSGKSLHMVIYFIYNVMLVAQSCLTLCNPQDCSRPGFSVHGILQARILDQVAISFSNFTYNHKQNLNQYFKIFLQTHPYMKKILCPK